MVNRKLKISLVIIVLAAVLLCPVAMNWTSAQADTTTPERAQVYMDYLGKASPSAPGPKDSDQGLPGFELSDAGATTDSSGNDVANTIFWIGIRVDDISKVNFLTEHGMHDLEIGIEYDPTYVMPCDDLSIVHEASAFSKSDWADIITEYNIYSGTNYADIVNKGEWDNNYYTFNSDYSAYDVQPDEVDGRVETAKSGWAMQFISIGKKDVNELGNRFKGVTDANDDGFYLVRLPFYLKSAPTDGTTPPTFRLSIGPSSFVVTTGVGGTATDSETYAMESESYCVDATHNLGNYFQCNANLNIFKKAAEDTMSTFEVKYMPAGVTDETAMQPLDLLDELGSVTAFPRTDAGAVAAEQKFYVKVPIGATKLRLQMGDEIDNVPTVVRYDYSITSPTASDLTAVTVKPLDPAYTAKWVAMLDLDAVTAAGYTETVRITVGSQDYYLYIYREAEPVPEGEPTIELLPGNSPYGLIERMGLKDTDPWDATKIQEAKDKFDVGYKFVTGYVPDYGDEKVTYTVEAWGDTTLSEMVDLTGNYKADVATDPTAVDKWGEEDVVKALDVYNAANAGQYAYVNFDMDPTAVIAFMANKFIDPGIVVRDAKGQEVTLSADETVVRTVKFKNMDTPSLNSFYTTTDEEIVTTLNGSVDENIVDISSFRTKPGIYTIEYSYKSGVAKAYRTLIVTANIGDVDLNSIANSIDANLIRQSKFLIGFNADSDRDVRLMQYRIVDVDKNTISNAIDANLIKQSKTEEFYTSTEDLK